MKAGRMIAGLLVGAMSLAGCGSDPPTGAEEFDGEFVAELRPEDAGAVGDAVNAFGFDLLSGVTDGRDNTVTSPLSVATMLAMVLAGADGDTAKAMAEVLHLEHPQDVRVGELLRQLTDTDEVTLSVANALWRDEETPFEDDYLEFVRDVFAATMAAADLGAPETAEEIDAWVSEHTEGLIDGIAEDLHLPNPQAVLVLLNAVYFFGEWTTAFDPEATADAPFKLWDGARVEVPLMRLTGVELEHAVRDGYQMLRLPYGESGRYGMELLLPDEGHGLPQLLTQLDAAEWRKARSELTEQTMDEVAIPRFELEWEATLTDPLIRLGMGPVFDSSADLSRMSPADPSLDIVAHKTYLRVDEEGTEAAAVTGGLAITSAPADPLVFRADRPFAFTVSDHETGTILFLGTVTDPRG